MKRLDFWSTVRRSDSSECWPWAGSKTLGGYGTFRGTTAHRVAFEFLHGPVPAGLVVMHTCDNPCCCNPAHLHAGTQQENIADMHNKGRAGDCRVFGERHGRTKITDTDVHCIRLLHACGAVQRQLACAFGVRQNQISRIVRGENRIFF